MTDYLVLYALLNLHMLRNVLLLPYLALVVAAYATVLRPGHTGRLRGGTAIALWLLAFVVTGAWAAVRTSMHYGAGTALYGTARYFFVMPLALCAGLRLGDDHSVRKVLVLFCAIGLVGLATIPLQFYVGPIGWFGEVGVRAGLPRYGSLLGNLVAAGTVVPALIAVVLCLRIPAVVAAASLITTAGFGLLTLQKSALLGIPLGITAAAASKRPRRLYTLAAVALLAVVGFFVADRTLGDWEVWTDAKRYAVSVFQMEDPNFTVGDRLVLDSIVDRFTWLPALSLRDLLSQEGRMGLLTGGGFGMLGPALLPPDVSPYETAHNGYVDLVLVGGVLHLTAFLGLLVTVAWTWWRTLRARRRADAPSEVPAAMLAAVIVAAIAFGFGGSITFQPAMASLFWTAVGVAWRLQSSAAPVGRRARVAFRPAQAQEAREEAPGSSRWWMPDAPQAGAGIDDDEVLPPPRRRTAEPMDDDGLPAPRTRTAEPMDADLQVTLDE